MAFVNICARKMRFPRTISIPSKVVTSVSAHFGTNFNWMVSFLRRPESEPKSGAWKAPMLTVTPPTPVMLIAGMMQRSLQKFSNISMRIQIKNEYLTHHSPTLVNRCQYLGTQHGGTREPARKWKLDVRETIPRRCTLDTFNLAKRRVPGSNQGPSDLQSDALPTELPRPRYQGNLITRKIAPTHLT